MPYAPRFCLSHLQCIAQVFLAGVFAGALGAAGVLAGGALGFAGALFCVELASGTLKDSALGCEAFGWELLPAVSS